MFIAQILHIPDAKQCRCPEKFIEIFGFSERTKIWTFWFWHADRGRTLQVDNSAMRIPGVWGDARFAERAQILHAPALLWASPPSPCLLGCLECPHRASFLFKSLLSMCWGGFLSSSPVVGDQLDWANPESSMAQLEQSSLDHHLVLIPLIEAIVGFKTSAQWFSAMSMAAYSRSQWFQG